MTEAQHGHKDHQAYHDERNDSVALGDFSGMPSAADLRGIPSEP